MNRLTSMSALILWGCLTPVACAVAPPITSIAFTPDRKAVVTTSQSGVAVHSWPALKRQRVIKATASNLHCLCFSPDGKHLAIGGGDPASEGIVEVFSWPEAKSVALLKEHEDSVRSIVWQSNSRLLSASLDRQIKLWELTKKASLRSFQGHSRGVSALALLRDGKTLVSTGDDVSVRVWTVTSGKLVRSLSQHSMPIHAVALRPGNEGLPLIATASADKTIRFWQPTIGRMARFARLKVEPLSIAWLKDGERIVASCVDGCVRVVDATEVTVTKTLSVFKGWAYAIAVHPTDGSLVVGGSNGRVRRVILD